MDRPLLTKAMSAEQFRNFYYLKEELAEFCRKEGLQTSGSKMELTERIVIYLTTGEKCVCSIKRVKPKTDTVLKLDSSIEQNFKCTEKHRAFFQSEIGDSFSFCVAFQKWLKANAGKTYQDAITAYYQILAEKKMNTTVIDSQFEYNTYIRDFFLYNKGMSLKDAITCWKYKKSLPGHNKYEIEDLCALHE